MSGFPWTLLADLRCPCCGSSLQAALELTGSSEGLGDGVLRCDCYEYPVVNGIPVLRQMSPVSSNQNGAVERLRQGDSDGALRWLLDAGSAPGVPVPSSSPKRLFDGPALLGRLRNLLAGKPVTASKDEDISRLESFEAVLRASRPLGYANYLFQRFANPSFLGALPPLLVLGETCGLGPRRRFLELLCGVGHASSVASALYPAVETIMTDVDYVNLFIARRYLAPKAAALCLDAELPLPFLDASVDGIFCMDGLHYVRSKVALLNEVDRILSAEGAWVFAHMHNATGDNINPGAPLHAQGYTDRFAFGQKRLLPESEVLRQFCDTGSLDLSQQPSTDILDSSSALTLVGARTDGLWKQHAALDDALSRCRDLLALNPLYKVENSANGLIARVAWPSETLREECTRSMSILPETVHLSSLTLQKIASACAGEELSDEIRALIRSFVLVPLPDCYPRTKLH